VRRIAVIDGRLLTNGWRLALEGGHRHQFYQGAVRENNSFKPALSSQRDLGRAARIRIP
jgi:hypothetical protein